MNDALQVSDKNQGKTADQVRNNGRINTQLLSQLGVTIVSKLIPLASVFVYSRYMSVAEYGVLGLSQSYLWIFVLLLSLNLHVAVGRYIYEPEAKEGAFLASTLAAVGTVFLVGGAGIVLRSAQLSSLLHLPVAAILLLLVIVLGTIAESLITQLAIHDRRGGFLFITMASKASVSFVGCMILLLMLTSQRYMAILIAEAVASLGLCIFVAYVLHGRVLWKPRRAYVQYMVKYALPLIPYMLALTLMSQFDRILLNRYYDNVVTGYYSLGYNIGSLLMMAVSAALNAFTPAFFDALNKGEFGRVQTDSDTLFNCAVIATAGIVLFGTDVAGLVLPRRYGEGFVLIPVIALGGLCSVIFQSWIRVLAFQHRTVLISGIATLGAAFSIGFNMLLLPRIDYKIAAVTSVLTYLLMSVFCVIAINSISVIRVSIWREIRWISLIALMIPLAHFESTSLLFILKVLLLLGCAWPLRQSVRALISRGVT